MKNQYINPFTGNKLEYDAPISDWRIIVYSGNEKSKTIQTVIEFTGNSLAALVEQQKVIDSFRFLGNYIVELAECDSDFTKTIER